MKVRMTVLYKETAMRNPRDDGGSAYHASLIRIGADDAEKSVAILHLERRVWNEKKHWWQVSEIEREVIDLYRDNPGDGILTRQAIAKFDKFIELYEGKHDD